MLSLAVVFGVNEKSEKCEENLGEVKTLVENCVKIKINIEENSIFCVRKKIHLKLKVNNFFIDFDCLV